MEWQVDLEQQTVTSPAGWVFKFEPAPGEPEVFDGRLIQQPTPLTPEHLAAAASIAAEAGDAWNAARSERQ